MDKLAELGYRHILIIDWPEGVRRPAYLPQRYPVGFTTSGQAEVAVRAYREAGAVIAEQLVLW